ALYRAGRQWWIYPSDTRAAQSDRQETDPWEYRIERYLQGRERIDFLNEIMDMALGLPLTQQGRREATRIGIILRQLGCTQAQQAGRGYSDGKQVRVRPWIVPARFRSQSQAVVDANHDLV